MFAHLGSTGVCLVFSMAVVVMFFCGIEWAPKMVYRVAQMARFVGPVSKEKLVRFW